MEHESRMTLVLTGRQPVQGLAERTVPVTGIRCSWWNHPVPFGEDRLLVDGRWTCQEQTDRSWPFSYPVTLICHLLTGGKPSGFVIIDETRATEIESKYFRDEYQAASDKNRALAVKMKENGEPQKIEFLLAPIRGRDEAGVPKPVFGVYPVSVNMGHFFLSKIIRRERLPVVLDLDETLLKAHSINQLDTKWQDMKGRMRDSLNEPTLQDLKKMECENLLYTDKVLLSRFKESEEVDIGVDDIRKATLVDGVYFQSDPSAPIKTVRRPFLDLYDDEGVYLSKILRDNPSSSILVRPRPGWKEAYDRLTSPDGPDDSGIAVEINISTAAEKNYAHEVWRMLDYNSILIPEAERPYRIVTLSKRKSLHKTYRRHDPNPLVNPLPLALIVDDIVDVWDPSVHNQVLQIRPFDPYQVEYCDAERAMKDLDQAIDIILEVKKRFFEVLKSRVMLEFDQTQPSRELHVNNLETDYINHIPSTPDMPRLLHAVLRDKGMSQHYSKAASSIQQQQKVNEVHTSTTRTLVEADNPSNLVTAIHTPIDPRVGARKPMQRIHKDTASTQPSKPMVNIHTPVDPRLKRKKSNGNPKPMAKQIAAELDPKMEETLNRAWSIEITKDDDQGAAVSKSSNTQKAPKRKQSNRKGNTKHSPRSKKKKKKRSQ